jgi:Holliday junction resolvase RusA-like endonuclease
MENQMPKNPETGIQKIIIPGRPITKKNHQQISKHGGIIQSEAYQIYETASLWELKKYRVRYTGKVSLCARYWMPDRRSWPDLIGLLQATSDILQKAGIIKNDKLVVSYDGSRIVGIDKQNPRVEIEIKSGG